MIGDGTHMTLLRGRIGLVPIILLLYYLIIIHRAHAGDQDAIHYMCKEAPAAVLELVFREYFISNTCYAIT